MCLLEVEKKLNQAFHEINTELVSRYKADGSHQKDYIYVMLDRTKDSIYKALFNLEMVKTEAKYGTFDSLNEEEKQGIIDIYKK